MKKIDYNALLMDLANAAGYVSDLDNYALLALRRGIDHVEFLR